MVVLKESKKLIYDSHYFSKEDGSSAFIIKYIDSVPTGETYTGKDGKSYQKFEDKFKNFFIDKSKLPENYQKMDLVKICQDLKGKSIVITTSIGD